MQTLPSSRLFTGYRGQMFYAAACIRCGRLEQAEKHLRMALGCANLEKAHSAKGNIMTALNHVRKSRGLGNV